MVVVGDPVRVGLVASLAHPGGNVTGTSFLGPDLAPKRLQLLKQVIPSAVRVALLINPNNAANIIFRDESETAARDLGISLIQVEASSVPDLDTNLSGVLSQRPDALMVTGAVTRNMAEPLRRTYAAVPGPKRVVAVGDCARDCGVFAGAYGVAGAARDIVPVDAEVPGCPPRPEAIVAAVRELTGR